MTRTLGCILVCALASTLTAQSTRSVDWEQLRRAAVGKDATVQLRDASVAVGRVATAEGQALTVGQRTIACAEIASLELHRKSRRALWTAVGAGAGLAAGALLGTRFSNEGNDSAAAGVAAGMAGAGALVGYLAGRSARTRVLTLAPGACKP
ncbi:MAG: hypothetical protein R2724_04100 [Bryobacterales bacterium]